MLQALKGPKAWDRKRSNYPHLAGQVSLNCALHDKVHDCAAQVLCHTSLNLARLQQTSSWQHALHMPGI